MFALAFSSCNVLQIYLLWLARRKVEKKTFIVHGTQRWNLISVRK
jgi:hypothetical protein